MIKYPIKLFLDSNIFIDAKYDFSSNGIFSRLLEFINDGKIEIYISHIVECEVINHIETEVTTLCNAIKKTRGTIFGKISEQQIKDSSLENAFNWIDKNSLKNEFVMKFKAFLLNSNAVILNSDFVDCNQIINDYFNFVLPFEDKLDKKNEFPDAIMSSKLKLEFGATNPICIISNDKGFCKSFDQLKGFETVDKLKIIFDRINKQEKIIYENVIKFMNTSETINSISTKIDDDLIFYNTYIEGNYMTGDGIYGGYDYNETNIIDSITSGYKVLSLDKIASDYILLTLECQNKINANCSFYSDENSVWDREDKEYIYREKGYVHEIHNSKFECEVKVKYLVQNFVVDLNSLKFNLTLNETTRTSIEAIEFDDSILEHEYNMEKMEALEGYYNH